MSSVDRSQQMGTGKIPVLLLKFSAPAVAGMLAQALYNIVDRVFVGQAVGPLGIAGATVSFPFMLVMMAFAMLTGFGSAALISIRLGQGRKDRAEQVLGNALVLLTIVGLLLTVVGLCLLDQLLTLFGASPAVLPYARDYLQVIVMGAVVQSIGFGLNAAIRGEGNPRIAMITMLIGASLNSILDPIFLFACGWGMRGAAASTVISQAVAALWVLNYFLRGPSLLKVHLQNMRPHWGTCVAIAATGSPIFATQMAGSVTNAILNNQLRVYGGDVAISAMGIIYSVAIFVAMPIFGVTQGAQPIIGYNHGANRFDRVKTTLFTAILIATLFCTAGFLLVMFFPAQVIALFNRDDRELMELGTQAIRICLLMLPIVGFQIVSSNYFLAVGKPKHALFLGLTRQVLLFIPAILLLPHFLGLNGIWIAIPTADLGSSILTSIWLVIELRSRQTPRNDLGGSRGTPGSDADSHG